MRLFVGNNTIVLRLKRSLIFLKAYLTGLQAYSFGFFSLFFFAKFSLFFEFGLVYPNFLKFIPFRIKQAASLCCLWAIVLLL
jgi:hypothetical protein